MSAFSWPPPPRPLSSSTSREAKIIHAQSHTARTGVIISVYVGVRQEVNFRVEGHTCLHCRYSSLPFDHEKLTVFQKSLLDPCYRQNSSTRLWGYNSSPLMNCILWVYPDTWAQLAQWMMMVRWQALLKNRILFTDSYR